MQNIRVPAWIMAISILAIVIGFFLSTFFLGQTRYFAGLKFGPPEAGSEWPLGSYGIFAAGPCPSGFTRYEAHVLAFPVDHTNAVYVKESSFGDSWIGLHNNRESGNKADVKIVSCFRKIQ